MSDGLGILYNRSGSTQYGEGLRVTILETRRPVKDDYSEKCGGPEQCR